jgi:hypothetical protein
MLSRFALLRVDQGTPLREGVDGWGGFDLRGRTIPSLGEFAVEETAKLLPAHAGDHRSIIRFLTTPAAGRCR